MMPISDVTSGAVQPLTAPGKAVGTPEVQRPGEDAQVRTRRPAVDAYVPEEKREPSGLYWLGRDEDGQRKVYFDDPARPADAPEGPEKASENEERWACKTDQVDREIESLKERRQELEQRLNSETDEAKVRDLERQLAQVERELEAKDSDAYRRQRASYTRLS